MSERCWNYCNPKRKRGTYGIVRLSLTRFEVAHSWLRDASILGFPCSYYCSVDDGARDRIPAFEYDYEHHFNRIEHEQDFLRPSSNSATSKLTRRVAMFPLPAANLLK